MLSENTLISVGAAYSAGTTDVTGATADMADWDGIMVVLALSAIATGAVTTLKLQQGSASDLSDAADLLGTGSSIADTDDDGVVVLDLYQPRERFVRAYLDKDGSNSVAGTILYIRYRGKEAPVTQGSGVTVERHQSPAEGTA